MGLKLKEAWNFFQRKVLILTGIHGPSKSKELSRGISRFSLIRSHLKKKYIIKQELSA